jgi:hypothetical protein
MKFGILKFYLTFIFISIYISGFSQEKNQRIESSASLIDSLRRSGVILNEYQKRPDIVFSTPQALQYLLKNIHPQIWKNPDDTLRKAFSRLIYEAGQPPLDSLREMLIKYPYDSLSIPRNKFFIWEPRKLKIPVHAKPELNMNPDSIRLDSLGIAGNKDSLKIKSVGIKKPADTFRSILELKDTTVMVIAGTLKEATSSYSKFPFRYFNNPFQSDSIKAAVSALIKYLDYRDSTVINFTGVGKNVTPIMLNSRAEKEIRFWMKNEFSDSVTIWIGNSSRNTIGLYLEQGVNFRRPVRQGNYARAKTNVQSVDNKKIMDLKNIAVLTPFWKYRTEASYVLNQASLSNWVKGGESSISTVLDVTGYSDYDNKNLKLSSNNFARIKFGYMATGQDGIRKNIDLLETNSKLNHKAFGKFDFSAILLFKTQIAKGRNYFKNAAEKDTSNLVSKFMNPAVLTIGFGLDYKPNKTTSINFSPFSYKGTFVTDPAYFHNKYDSTRIDQTQYGIAKNRKSLNEPGVSFMITNEFKPVETLTIINRLQLFTNYIHNPQNVDVDWEMIATAKLNWFTDIRFNTHLVFDDDTKTVEQYKNGKPILRPDGTEKKTARIQFKEMLGLSLFFRF